MTSGLTGAAPQAASRFGKLVVLSEADRVRKNGQVRRRWLCRCDCGTDTVVTQYELTSGKTKSCGCLRVGSKTSVTHGKSKTRTWNIWANITKRCRNPKCREYKWYGARGVDRAPEWDDYAVFLKDMGECPEGFSIERLNVNLGYAPGNCEWIPLKDQRKNCTDTIWVEIEGSRMCLKDACKLVGVPYMRIYKRITAQGLSFGQALLKDENANYK